MSWRLFLSILVWIGSSPSVLAEAKMEAEVYPLGLADFEIAEKFAKEIVSKDGKLIADKKNNRLILYDYPEKHTALSKALREIKPPAQNVRIQVAFNDHTIGQSNGISVEGRLRVGGVVIRTGDDPNLKSTRIQGENMSSSVASLVQQELLVMSGGRAHLRIGTDVPYADWFWSYGLKYGLWDGIMRWKEVGAQLVVEPYVIGNTIRVRLTPEFSYIVEGNPIAVVVEKLTTEVFVENGEAIDLGGLKTGDNEFFSKFLTGYNHLGEKRSLRIILRPTIEQVGPP